MRRSDWLAWGFNGLLGATNGHLAALTLMHAPSLVDEGLRCVEDTMCCNHLYKGGGMIQAVSKRLIVVNGDCHACQMSSCVFVHC